MAVEIDTFQRRLTITKSPLPNPSALDLRRNFDGSTLSDYHARKDWLVQLSDELLLLIFLKYCDRISAFEAGLACKRLVDVVHGEFYRKVAQNDEEIADIVMWTAQRGTLTTLERLSYHLPPGRSLRLNGHTNVLRSPVTWSEVKRYPNGNLYRYFSQIDYARGQIEEGLVDLNGDLWNGKRYSGHQSVVLKHGLGGWAPIHIAALFGNAEMVEYLVSRGVSIDTQDHSKAPRSALFYSAVSERFAAVLPCVVRLGADINQKVPRPKGRPIEWEAGIGGSSSVYMPLLACLCDKRCYQQALMLLRAGARANYKTSHRKTLLHLCTTHANNHATRFDDNTWFDHGNWTTRELAELIRALIVEGATGPFFAAACEALASLVSPYPAVPVLGLPGGGGGGYTNNNNQGKSNKNSGSSKIIFDADAQNRRGETVLMVACDRVITAVYKYEGPPFFASTNSSSGGGGDVKNEQPAPAVRTAIKVFLEALRPSMELKDKKGFRVADRIFRVENRKKVPPGADAWQHPVRPYLLAYARGYLQFPVPPSSSFGARRRPTSAGGGSSNSSSSGSSSNGGDGNHRSGMKDDDNSGLTRGTSFEEMMGLQRPSLVFPVGPPTKGWRKMEIDGVTHWQPDPNPEGKPWTVLEYYGAA
ncbi:hypothetical protein PG990_014707 [Apiospora arundinis]